MIEFIRGFFIIVFAIVMGYYFTAGVIEVHLNSKAEQLRACE